MALSQKHAGKMRVPWYNSQEWKQVKNLIFGPYSTRTDKERALEIILLWKIRTPQLPGGVEGTLTILDALLTNEEAFDSRVIRQLYGAALTRFLNLCAASTDKQGTLYKTAKQNNIPDWIVDLRHDSAHSHVTPSAANLQLALKTCFQWLEENYWKKQEEIIQDFVIVPEKRPSVESLVKVYCQLVSWLHKHGNVHTEEISSVQVDLLLKFEIVPEPEEHLKGVLQEILQKLEAEITWSNQEEVCDAIVSGNFMDVKEGYPDHFVTSWQDLLNILLSKNALGMLLKKLLRLHQCDDETMQRTASLWIREICEGLLAKNKENKTSEPKIKFKHYNNIRDLHLLKISVLENPNVYTLNFLNRFLQLCSSSEEYIRRTEQLVESFIVPQAKVDTDEELHTLNDLNLVEAMDCHDSQEVINGAISQPTIDETPSRRLRLVKDTSIFAGCPLGVVSHHRESLLVTLH